MDIFKENYTTLQFKVISSLADTLFLSEDIYRIYLNSPNICKHSIHITYVYVYYIRTYTHILQFIQGLTLCRDSLLNMTIKTVGFPSY